MGLSTLALGLALAFSVTPARAGASTAATVTVSLRRGAPLTDTSLGPNTVLKYVSMVNGSLGYAVVGTATQRGTPYAIARTITGGASWTLRAALPITSFDQMSSTTGSSLDFVSGNVGYLSTSEGSIYVTTNAGISWSRLQSPGIWPTYAIAGPRVYVASDVCRQPPPTYGPLKCPSELSTFVVGATAPTTSSPIPALGPAGAFRAATVLGATTSTVVVAEGGHEASHSSLLRTTNNGKSWQLAKNPCEGPSPQQLLIDPGASPLLYCFGDGGMSQGTSELWQSRTPSLSTWRLLSKASQMGSAKNSIGDVINTLYYSENHAWLFGAMGGASNSLEVSRDGGRQWKRFSLPLTNYGGAPSYVSTFGASGAIYGISGGAQFRTLNATTWHQLPGLVAGTYEHLSICSASTGTTVHLHPTMTGIPASTLDFPFVFTNHGSRACYLNGYPATQPVHGPTHAPIKTQPYISYNGKRGGFVVLRAHGGLASVVLESEAAGHYTKSFCAAQTMTGVVIRFAAPSTFYVATPPRSVCTGVPTVLSGGVTPGVVTWL